jgi:hypothetical protein
VEYQPVPNAEQEDHIDRIWKMVEADNQEAPPPGLEQGFKQDLRMLVAQKQDLFRGRIRTSRRRT